MPQRYQAEQIGHVRRVLVLFCIKRYDRLKQNLLKTFLAGSCLLNSSGQKCAVINGGLS